MFPGFLIDHSGYGQHLDCFCVFSQTLETLVVNEGFSLLVALGYLYCIEIVFCSIVKPSVVPLIVLEPMPGVLRYSVFPVRPFVADDFVYWMRCLFERPNCGTVSFLSHGPNMQSKPFAESLVDCSRIPPHLEYQPHKKCS